MKLLTFKGSQLLLAAFFILCASALMQSCNLFSSKPTGDFHVLLFGVNDYNLGDNDLNYTDDDARDMYTYFSDFSDTISMGLNDQASKTAILQAIAQLPASDSDTTLFFFSGHGLGTLKTSFSDDAFEAPADVLATSFLIPQDASWETVADATGMISARELLDALSAVPGKKIVFLDICHSGGFVPSDGYDVDGLPEDYHSKVNTFSESWQRYFTQQDLSAEYSDIWVLSASGAFEESWEGSSLKNGYINYYFLQGLGYNHVSETIETEYPADSNADGYITINEAYSYVYNTFKQSPEFSGLSYNKQYLPHLSGGPEDIILVDTGKRTY